MPAIGAVSCDFVKGEAPVLKERSDVWQFPGHDGYGLQLLGLGNGEFSFTAVKFGTDAQVDTWIDQIEPLQGTTVTIVNDRGTSFANCFITKVSVPRKTNAVNTGRDTRGALRISGVRRA